MAGRSSREGPCELALTLPLTPAEHVDLEDDKEKKRTKHVVKEATVKSWLQKFPWLEITPDKLSDRGHPRGTCKLCMEHCHKTSAWSGQGDGFGAVIQDGNILSDHEKSAHHVRALSRASIFAGGPNSIGHAMGRARKAAHVVKQGVVPVLIMAALWLIKEGIAGHKFASLLELFGVLGVQHIAHKYNHRRYYWSAMYACSEVLLASTLLKVADSPFIGLLCDGGTDISTQNHILVYLRYLDTTCFSFVTVFLCCVSVKADDALHHYEVLLGILESLGIDKRKLVAICTDGASNYMGVHVGVQKQLKDKLCPYMIGMHCCAHRTALVMNDAGSRMRCLQELDGLLTAVHGLFCKSHKRQQEWESFARERGITRLKFPLYVKTRWLSRAQCLDVLCSNLPVLLAFLSQYNDCSTRNNPLSWSKAVQVRRRLMSLKAVSTLFLVLDMLQPVTFLCTKLQSDDILPHEVNFLVNQTVQQLEGMFIGNTSLKDAPLPHFKSFRANVRKSGEWKPGPGLSFQLRKCKLRVLRDEMEFLAKCIVQCFRERFQSSSLLACFVIFVPTSYSSMPREKLDSYGKEEFKTLLKHFAGAERGTSKLFEFDGASMAKEFFEMKCAMWDKVNLYKVTDTLHAWRLIKSDARRLLFPKLLVLVDIMFVVPVQTAVVERGFSMHRIIKNRLSNRMSIMTLDSLLRIKLLTQGQSVNDFDVEAAVAVHNFVPFERSDNTKLRALFHSVSNIELGLLVDGVDEGPEPDLSKGVDDEDEDVGEPWVSEEEEEEEEIESDDGDMEIDCFGEEGTDLECNAESPYDMAAELDAL